jgi:hypothetical protein
MAISDALRIAALGHNSSVVTLRRGAHHFGTIARSGRVAHRQESVMADGKSKNSKQDRGRLSSGDHYEIRDFAHEFDISLGQVRDLIRRHGNDRATLEREAQKLKRISRSTNA